MDIFENNKAFLEDFIRDNGLALASEFEVVQAIGVSNGSCRVIVNYDPSGYNSDSHDEMFIDNIDLMGYLHAVILKNNR